MKLIKAIKAFGTAVIQSVTEQPKTATVAVVATATALTAIQFTEITAGGILVGSVASTIYIVSAIVGVILFSHFIASILSRTEFLIRVEV